MKKPSINRIATGVVAVAIATFGVSGVAFASAPPKYQPYVTLSSYYGHPADMFTVQGHSFGSDESIKIDFAGHVLTVGSDGSGNFNKQITVDNVRSASYVVTASGNTYHETATARYQVDGYVGRAWPSTYYVLPGQMMSVSGTAFQPHEMITVKDTTTNQTIATLNADGSGSFMTSSFMVPYNQANTSQMFAATGGTSGITSEFTVGVGTYYPQLNPSTYYVPMGGSLKASVTNLAPNEVARFFENGMSVGTATADSHGTINDMSLPTPVSGSTFNLTVTGEWVGDSSSRTITVQR